MPSYLVSAKESFVPVELYKPPIEALGDMLRIKQQQYMQGFNQSNSLYNSVFNSPVYGEEAKARKDQYLSQIGKELKDFASLDLSLPQNVEMANKSFEPFMNDTALLDNISRVKSNSANRATMESYEFSDDPKKRAQFHAAQAQDLNDELEEIERAGLDPNKQKRIQRRKFTPFYDMKADLAELASKEKNFEIKYDTPDGKGYFVNITNGQRSTENFELWAQDKLNDPKYNAQLTTLARVERNQDRRSVRAVAPDMTDEQVDEIVNTKYIQDATRFYNKQIEETAATRTALEGNMNQMGEVILDPNAPGYNAERARVANQYMNEYKQLGSKATYLNTSKENTLKAIQTNPLGYLAEKVRSGYARSFATGKAAVTSVEYKNDENPWKADASKYNWAKLAQDQYEFQQEQITGVKKGEKGTSTDKDAPPADTQPKFMGTELDETSNMTEAHMKWKSHMDNLDSRIKNGLFDTQNGLVSVIKTLSPTISETDIMHYASALRKQESEGDGDYQFTAEEKAAAGRIDPILKASSGVNVTGPKTARQAIYNVAKGYFDKIGTGVIKMDPEMSVNLFRTIGEYETNVASFKALNDEYENILTKNVMSNPAFKNLVAVQGGKKVLVGADYLATQMPNIVVQGGGSNEPRKISSKELGELYMKGEIRYDNFDRIYIGNNVFRVTSIDKTAPVQKQFMNSGFSDSGPMAKKSGTRYLANETRYFFSHNNDDIEGLEQWEKVKPDNVFTRHGASAKFRADFDSAMKQVVPNQAYYEAMTGRMSPVIGNPFNPSATVRQESGIKAIEELAVPNNTSDVYTIGENNSKVSLNATQKMAMLNLLRGGEDVIEKLVGNNPTYHPFGAGKGYYELTIRPDASKDMLKDAGLEGFIGKPIRFQLSETVKGPTLNKLMVNEKFYTYNKIFMGQPIESPELLKGAGFSYSIVPNINTADADAVTIHYKYKVWDPVKKMLVDTTASSQRRPIKGDGAVDIDVLKREADAMLLSQYQASAANQPTKIEGGVRLMDVVK